jgi:hypothetical protein
MGLGEKQELFSNLWAHQVLWCNARGIQIRSKELWRPPETAALYAEQGRGIKNSLHTLGLAIDVVFSIDGKVTFDAEDYKEAAMFWESRHPLACAGYFFTGKIARDAGHFGLSHNGVK